MKAKCWISFPTDVKLSVDGRAEKWIPEGVHHLGKVQEEMLGGADDGGLPAHFTLGFLQRAAVISDEHIEIKDL